MSPDSIIHGFRKISSQGRSDTLNTMSPKAAQSASVQECAAVVSLWAHPSSASSTPQLGTRSGAARSLDKSASVEAIHAHGALCKKEHSQQWCFPMKPPYHHHLLYFLDPWSGSGTPEPQSCFKTFPLKVCSRVMWQHTLELHVYPTPGFSGIILFDAVT